jgi:hypothetical protein
LNSNPTLGIRVFNEFDLKSGVQEKKEKDIPPGETLHDPTTKILLRCFYLKYFNLKNK